MSQRGDVGGVCQFILHKLLVTHLERQPMYKRLRKKRNGGDKNAVCRIFYETFDDRRLINVISWTATETVTG